jgi:4-hydroxybenzoate polyprenyltransferase
MEFPAPAMSSQAAAPARKDALPDADRRNWVDRFAPARLRPWLKLGRFDRPAGVWLLMLPGWQGVALAPWPTSRPSSI